MRTVVWVLAVVAFAFMVYFVVGYARNRQSGPRQDALASDVGPDSIDIYEQRILELEASRDRLKERMASAGTLDRPEVQERLRLLEVGVEALRDAIARWKGEQNRAGRNEAYRQCILLYGKASGVCQSLAPDTVAPAGGK